MERARAAAGPPGSRKDAGKAAAWRPSWFPDAVPSPPGGQEPAAALARAAEQLAGRYRERAAALNREIDRHNLSVPLPSMQRPRLRVEAELAAFLAALDGEASP